MSIAAHIAGTQPVAMRQTVAAAILIASNWGEQGRDINFS